MMKHNASFSEAFFFRTLVASLVMKRAGSRGGERRQAKRHLARFLLPTVLYAQKGMSVKGADERI